MLNNFGAAGSNAALLLEEYPGTKYNIPIPTNMSLVFGLSAKTQNALDALRSRYLVWLKSPESEAIRFCDIVYTSTARRQVYPYRMAMVAKNKEDLIQKCGSAPVVHVKNSSGKVIFVFSGQGSQYIGMGASPYHSWPVFERHINECHFFLIENGFPGVLQNIIGAPPEGSGLTQQETFEASQAAIFALEYALAKLWMSWGVLPAAVIGHRCVWMLFSLEQ